VLKTSMLKTLAGKHKSTVAKMARKYKANLCAENMIATINASKIATCLVIESVCGDRERIT